MSDLAREETKLFSMEDENLLRYWARKITIKNLEILKACKVVVESFENL